jgi:hypothetical protein
MSEIPFTFVGSQNNTAGHQRRADGDIATSTSRTTATAPTTKTASTSSVSRSSGSQASTSSGASMLEKGHLRRLALRSAPAGRRHSRHPAGAAEHARAKKRWTAKEKQMAALGARLIQADSTIKTATQQNSEDSVAQSVLSACAATT